MSLLDAIATDGLILLAPGGISDGQPIDGTVDAEWFAVQFPALAQSPVPLAAEQYSKLKAIDSFWAANAERWRAEGRI